METSKITFDQLPHVVSGLSEKLDRVLDLLEKAGIAGHSKQSKSSLLFRVKTIFTHKADHEEKQLNLRHRRPKPPTSVCEMRSPM